MQRSLRTHLGSYIHHIHMHRLAVQGLRQCRPLTKVYLLEAENIQLKVLQNLWNCAIQLCMLALVQRLDDGHKNAYQSIRASRR
jgi:hypothetical protein